MADVNDTVEKRNKVKLKINGSEFVISAEESIAYIEKIAKMVDTRINTLYESNSKLSIPMATVLAALNYCDELEKERRITKELLDKSEYNEKAAGKAKKDLLRYAVENEQLKEEKAGLHRLIEDMRNKTGVTVEDMEKDEPKLLTDEPVVTQHVSQITEKTEQPTVPVNNPQPQNSPKAQKAVTLTVEAVEPELPVQTEEKTVEKPKMTGGFMPRSKPIAHTSVPKNAVPNVMVSKQSFSGEDEKLIYGKESYTATGAAEEEMMSFFDQRNS